MQTSPTSSNTLRRTRGLPSLSHVETRPFNEPIARVNKESIHWKRKVFHVLGIGTAAVAYALTPVEPRLAAIIFAGITALFVSLDLLRFYVPALNTKVKRDLGAFMRDYELESLSGSSWFLLASVLCAAMFPKPAAALGFLCLAVGDPVASFVGLRWGRTRLPGGGKSLEGSLALFGVSAVAGTLLLSLTAGLAPGAATIVATATAFVAAFAEWLPIKRVDDNFVLPLLSGAAATGLLSLVG